MSASGVEMGLDWEGVGQVGEGERWVWEVFAGMGWEGTVG